MDLAQSNQNNKSAKNNPSMGTINDIISKDTGEKETDISYQVMPIVIAAIKKTVEYSAHNQVVVY
jgi:hypothetical protein